ncbi:MAG TPA: hypothetical protein VMG10_10930, partial [Gemmataceae bacterium]|nr:hypothetical protein [Gemmataceae bacterium]
MTGRFAGWISTVALLATLSLSWSATTDPSEQDKSGAPAARMPERKTVTFPVGKIPVSKALA